MNLPHTFNLKAIIALVTFCALGCVFLNIANVTIRCEFGTTDFFGGYLPSGKVVPVLGPTPTGANEIVAKNVIVSAEGRWEREAGANVCYIELQTSLIQKWTIERYPNYRIDFPLPDQINDVRVLWR